MKKINPKRLFFAIFFSLLLTVGLFKVGSHFVTSVKADQLEDLNNQIKEYEAELARLKSQGNTLYNQIAQFNAQIRLTTLKIQETQEKILLLGGRIDQLEISLESLTDAFSMRANEIYKMKRLGDSLMLLVTASNLNEAVSRYHYLQKIQEADRELLVRLQEAQDVYEDEKVDQEDLQAQLEQQGQVLGAQKTAKANLLADTQNDEKRYQNLLSQAKAQLAAFRRFAISQGGATILYDQTVCDEWGCYYSQRDSQWGDVFLGGTEYLMKDSGCFVTSVAMLASHFVGKGSIMPSDIAQLSAAITSGGDVKHSFNVNNVNVSIGWASDDELDQRLSSGPVMAELYGGDHFIVILEKKGDQYIMHDPFLENGHSRPLTDRYNVSDISSLRFVSFN